MTYRKSASSNRLAWIDLAKGIGMVLVVIGHACAETTSIGAYWARDLIYTFHMPLFFIVSRYFAEPGPELPFALRRLKALIVPYVCYLFVIGLPLAVATHHLYHRSACLEFVLYFYGGQHLVTYMTTFWFVTSLLFAQIVFRAIRRICPSPHDGRMAGIILMHLQLCFCAKS